MSSSGTPRSVRHARGPGNDISPPSQQRQTVYLAKILTMLTLLALLPPGAWAWHVFRERRSAAARWDTAMACEASQDWPAAVAALEDYLRLRPDDGEAHARLAADLEQAGTQTARKSRAVTEYYLALGRVTPARQPPLRRKLGSLLLQLKRFPQATAEARTLLESFPDDPEGLRLLALSLFGQFLMGNISETDFSKGTVSLAVEKALGRNPGDERLAVASAEIYRNHPELLPADQRRLSESARFCLANERVDRAVEQGPENPLVRLARFRYRQQYGLPGEAEDLLAAVRVGPAEAEVLLAAAAYVAQARDRRETIPTGFDSVEHYCRAAIQAAPTVEQGYLQLGQTYWQRRDIDQAIAAWEAGLQAADGDKINLRLALVQALVARNRFDAAAEQLDRADEQFFSPTAAWSPGVRASLEAQLRFARGQWYLAKGDYPQAIARLRSVATIPPTDAAGKTQSRLAWLLLAQTHGMISDWDEAARAYERAASLVLDPQTWLAAAGAWQSARQLQGAIRCYQQALMLSADPETRLALAWMKYQYQRSLPPAARQWQRFRLALAVVTDGRTRGRLREPWRLSILEALAAAQGVGEPAPDASKPQAALEQGRKMLLSLESAAPQTPAFWECLAMAYAELDDMAAAARAASRFAAMAADRAGVALFEARLARFAKQYDRAKEILKASLAAAPADRRDETSAALLDLALERGDGPLAQRLLQAIIEKQPSNPSAMLRLCQIALEAGQYEKAASWIDRLKDLETTEGVHWKYCEARRLLEQTRDADGADLAIASKLAAQIQTQRPAWPEAYRLEAMLQEKRNNLNEAIAMYRRILDLEDRRPAIYARLATLLDRIGRSAEVRAILASFPADEPMPDELVRLKNKLQRP